MSGAAIESSLEAHLKETRSALEEIDSCLHGGDSSADNSELLKLKEELEFSVQETEEALLQLKKDRLLEAVDGDGYESDSEEFGESDEEQTASDDGEASAVVSDNDSGDRQAVSREDYLERALDEMHAAVTDAVKNGQQQETAHFAEWEAHGRGVASKLMAQMGYIPGKGLGREKQGMTAHIVSKQISGAKRAGIGTAEATEVGVKKKTKRGGRVRTAKKRARLEKEARAAEHGQKAADVETQGVFSVINKVIGEQSQSDRDKKKARNDAYENKCTAKSQTQQIGRNRDAQKGNREMLAEQLSRITNCKKRVLHLEEAVQRNAKNKTLLSVLKSKLVEARKELDRAQQRHSSLSKDVQRSFRNSQSEKF